MKNYILRNSEFPVSTKISCFQGEDGPDEYHITVHPYRYADINTQINWIYNAYKKVLLHTGIDVQSAVFHRYFFSDIVNQWEVFEKSSLYLDIAASTPCSISSVCQPPGNTAKIALWAYHVNDRNRKLEKSKKDNSISLKRGNLTHYWTSGLISTEEDTPYQQTLRIIENYNTFLKSEGMTFRDNVIRTWFFVQNIDVNYKEFVKARREIYEKYGLTKDTHFIASTGIQGSSREIQAKITMDAYSISGITPLQIKFLSAPEYLSPTYIYGVTFERGTSISYRDRKHIFISGTASINNKGEILYSGDVIKQLERTFTNIEALLKNAGASLKDVAVFIAYVRDISDYTTVMREMKKRFRNTPIIVAVASVCRPGWLVEVECIAIIPSYDPSLPYF